MTSLPKHLLPGWDGLSGQCSGCQGSLGVPTQAGGGWGERHVGAVPAGTCWEETWPGWEPAWASQCLKKSQFGYIPGGSPCPSNPRHNPGQYSSTEPFSTEGGCSPPLTSPPSPHPPHLCSPTRMNIPNFSFIPACVKQVFQCMQPGLEKTGMLQREWHKGAQQGWDAPRGKQSCRDDAGLISHCIGSPKGAVGSRGDRLPDPGPLAAMRRRSSSSARTLPARPEHCFHRSPPFSICSCQFLRALLHGATDSSDFLLQICSGPSPPRSASLGPV